jgi:hypothetical protein
VLRKGKTEIIKGIVGVLLCVCAVAGIYYWESYGRVRYEQTQILVLNQAVEPGELIKETYLSSVNRDKSILIKDPIRHEDEILGMVAKQYIPAGVQLSVLYFEENGLVPGEGEYIFRMPPDWIASYPSTLRRSDNVFLYPINEIAGKTSGSEGNIERAYEKSTNEVRLEHAEIGGETEETLDPVECLRIAFVKNQSNQEVQSVGESGRLNGTSNIVSIELIANMESIKRLDVLHEAGYKFMVLYK